jgi:hypothetical protein
MVSSSLLIEYGATRVLLGGDMEKEAWECVLADHSASDDKRQRLASHLVKVSHHGSPTGFTPDFCKQFVAAAQKPLAVVTPFNRHRYPLPNRAGVSEIQKWVSELIATNVSEARSACGVELPTDGTIPAHWLIFFERNPEFSGVLDPAFVRSTDPVRPLTEVPTAIIPDLIAEPKLIALLRPELRRCSGVVDADTTELAEKACRVSFYFDDKGNEVKRYIGSRAGTLTV